MKKKVSSRIIILIEAIILSVLIVSCNIITRSNETTVNGENITVTFFDAGKADSILIEKADYAVLIDTGYDEDKQELLDELEKREIDRLEYLILTHPDKDHIGGADEIINNISIDKIIEADCEKDSEDYEEYHKAAEENNTEIITLNEQLDITVQADNESTAAISIYPPYSRRYEGENDYSLIVKMSYGKCDFLFAGDIEKDRINDILYSMDNLKSMLLKVPHHGRIEDNSEQFFNVVKPVYAIITSDKMKKLDEAAEMLEGLGSEVYITGEGTVTAVCDGEKIAIEQ